jgi:protein TonB
MPQDTAPEVFTADEVARAAGVSRRAVEARLAASGIRRIPGTRYLTASDALRVTRALRDRGAVPAAEPMFSLPARAAAAGRDRRMPSLVSIAVHTTLLAAVLWLTSGATESASTSEPLEQARMVFLVRPGPGGGGGGGGTRDPRPAPIVERRGADRSRLAVPAVKPDPVLTTTRPVPEPAKPAPATPPIQPKPIERPPDPLPSRTLVAPVVQAAVNPTDRQGVIERAQGTSTSQGSGIGGGAGRGQGTGNGAGLGSGIGEGAGGGTGGGPFRPGSGIDPPRLLREVKAQYTEDARRRGITGDVELEIVIRRDGTVGDVTIRKGLGAGLDDRAVAAVRQWRFSPAHRQGEAVDVIVEVAVEFTLR